MVRGRTGHRRTVGAGVGATTVGGPSAEPRRVRETGRAPSLRRCICTGKIGDRARLLRFVVGPDGELVPDVAATLPGRGLWLTPRREMVERAAAKRLFARALRQPVRVPPDLADRIEALLAARCRDGLGLARRAGRAVGGFEKVRKALRAGAAAVLFEAVDAAEGGRRKMRGHGCGVPIVVALTATELGAAFGRDRLVHVAVAVGPLGTRLLADAVKLAGFREGAWVEGQPDVEPARPKVVLEQHDRRN